MATKNIECQLAQGQIGRYLRGEHISAEAVRQLESHIGDCSDCTEMLLHRRQAIVSMIGETVPTRAVIEVSEPEPAAPAQNASARLVAAINSATRQPKLEVPKPAPEVNPEPPKKAVFFTKPIIYSIGLAIVLIAMSYLSRSATSFFGPSASTAIPDSKPVTRHTTSKLTPITTIPRGVTPPAPAKPTFVPDSPARPTQPPTTHPATTRPTIQEPTSRLAPEQTPAHLVHRSVSPVVTIQRRPVHRIRRPRIEHRVVAARQHRPDTRTVIRVYDAQGNPIHP